MIIEINILNKQVTLLLKDKKNIVDSLDFPEERQMSEKLLPAIDGMLKKNKLVPREIEKMTVQSDLGDNFTTFRLAKTVADAWNYGNSLRITN
ncbi:MAG: hypothetical protein WC238_03015 [Parcubacteria group bacterium]|jgi:tRNA A37 threonylcarbamoyladenosine modification protein TsaB